MVMADNDPILVTGGYDHTIKIWSPYSGTAIRTLQHGDSQVNSLAIKNFLAAGGFQTIRLYDLNSNNPIINFEGVSKNVTAVGFQENGRFMYTGSEDCRVRIWDLNCSQPVCKRMFDAVTPVTSVCLHPNQVEVAISTQGGSIYLWDVKSDANEQLLPEVNASLNCVDISANGQYMAAINNKGNCYIWDLKSTDKSDQLTRTSAKLKFMAQTRYGLKCKFSPDSNFLVTTGGNGTCRIYRTDDDFKLYRELKIEKFWMWDIVFSNDSKYLFASSSDGTARLWKIETKTIEREYVGHSKALTSIAFRDEIVKP